MRYTRRIANVIRSGASSPHSVIKRFSNTVIISSKGSAFEDEGYIKFIVSKVNESNGNNNNTNEVQLPEAAKGPAIPPKGYLVEERCDHSYWVTDGSYNTMFLVTDKGVVAVDAPPSLGQKYLRAIAEVTDKPVNYMIYSHAHIDHIGAQDCSRRMSPS